MSGETLSAGQVLRWYSGRMNFVGSYVSLTNQSTYKFDHPLKTYTPGWAGRHNLALWHTSPIPDNRLFPTKYSFEGIVGRFEATSCLRDIERDHPLTPIVRFFHNFAAKCMCTPVALIKRSAEGRVTRSESKQTGKRKLLRLVVLQQFELGGCPV